MEIITNNNSDKHVSPKEIWNGRKSADQLSIDYEATEVFLSEILFLIFILTC